MKGKHFSNKTTRCLSGSTGCSWILHCHDCIVIVTPLRVESPQVWVTGYRIVYELLIPLLAQMQPWQKVMLPIPVVYRSGPLRREWSLCLTFDGSYCGFDYGPIPMISPTWLMIEGRSVISLKTKSSRKLVSGSHEGP